MRRSGPFIGLLAAALAPGCTLFVNGARNICNEPALAVEEYRFKCRSHALGRESWDRWPERDSASIDFRYGYIDGYADYLQAGRTTDPRPAPPKRYLDVTYQTPETLRAIEDYFAGFHAGAVDAQASGDRQRMVIPVIFPLPADHTILPATEVMPLATPAAEPLPPPREIPKTTSLPRQGAST
jgi:hypothetical protein